ncbi:hypothetical protein BJ508DRAFT_413255 [Ascobolus immersus RN42]|uniref:Clathrin light chain n=1 Tax=Ascobolus immersus RN42 TaxID=1160509 RepID=A0A3N4IDN4_ASCIM|nr:hypothetical protein BJ508DRAFT_413255 [Ascobolus immersus RN42]
MSNFPSIEEIEDGLITTDDAPIGTDDLLAREAELLGDDALMFRTPADDLLRASNTQSYDAGFPDISGGDQTEFGGPGGTFTSAAPYLPPQTELYGAAPTAQEEEEPQVIKEWRERQALEIQRRDELSAKRKAETIEKAQVAIDDFYENYNIKKDKTIAQTRQEAEEYLKSIQENSSGDGNSWDKIAKYVDMSEKKARGAGPDKTRFREMLLSLRKDDNAPGASSGN